MSDQDQQPTQPDNGKLTYEDFLKIDMRVGTISDIADFPNARTPSFKLWVDFGPEIGTRKTSAHITENYSKKELLGRQVIAVVNFPGKQIADFMSEVLVLGLVSENEPVVLLQPERKVLNGLRVL